MLTIQQLADIYAITDINHADFAADYSSPSAAFEFLRKESIETGLIINITLTRLYILGKAYKHQDQTYHVVSIHGGDFMETGTPNETNVTHVFRAPTAVDAMALALRIGQIIAR